MDRMVTEGRVFVLLARGFEEVDAAAVTRILRRAGLSVAVVGLTAGPVRGAHGMSLVPDCALGDVGGELPAAAVLPGGAQAARRLNSEPRVHTLLRQVASQQGYLLAIGTAQAVLRSAGVLGRRESGSGSRSDLESSGEQAVAWRGEGSPPGGLQGLRSERVQIEGCAIVGQGRGAAQEAARRLASILEN